MTRLRVTLDRPSAEYQPGETIRGQMSWDISGSPRKVDVQLGWRLVAEGNEESELVETLPLLEFESEGTSGFEFVAPEAPYSYEGPLGRLHWLVELVIEPGEQTARTELSISPTGRPIQLTPQEAVQEHHILQIE